MRTAITTNIQSSYSTMPTEDDQLFYDEQIQRFDADTIRNRYGENWKNFASNVREVTQPDGSIIKEYIIEDPSLLEEMKPSSQPIDSTSSTTGSDDEQQSLKNKFAQIKAKFEQKNTSNVMASRSTTSSSSNNTTTATTTNSRPNTRKQMDDLYARHRRASNESIPNNNNNNRNIVNQSVTTQNSHFRSHSIGSEKSKASSFRRFNSADEADEEVSRIHRQGEELRRYNQQTPSMSASIHDIPQQSQSQSQSHSQYEIVDEDGNPMVIDGVQDLIKMSGVRAREVPQPDGTIIKEYVIDDPQLLSQFRSQQQQQPSPMATPYIQQRSIDQNAPPPPPRVPLRPPILFRQGGSLVNDNLPYHIQEIHVLEPQRRYEYLTTTGRRVQFFITNSDHFNGQLLSDLDIRELTNAINLRLLPTSTPIAVPPPLQQQGSFAQAPFNLPKQWYPSVDLTHRQRLGSDNQPHSNNANTGFQPMQTDLSRSASSGALNQGSYISQNQQEVFHEPTHQWTRYQDSNNQRYQANEPFQSSAQFLPQQQMKTRSMHSPPIHTNHSSAFHQQSTTYPYQGQQQHGVRILNDFNQQRTAIVNDGNTRI